MLQLLRTELRVPLRAPQEACKLLDVVTTDDGCGQHRNKARNGVHPQRLGLTVELDAVVIESVILIPQASAAKAIDSMGNGAKVLKKLRCHVLIYVVVTGELERHRKHVHAVERHPGGAVRLLQRGAVRQRLGAIEHADIVESEKPSGKDVVAVAVLAIYPPGKVKQEFLKGALEKSAIRLRIRLRQTIHAPHRPRVHRRVHVGKGKLVRRQLAVSVHVPLTQEEHELTLGKTRIDLAETYAVERGVPRAEVGKFPFV